MDCGNLALAILAAGRGSRFGGRKLEAKIDNQLIGTITAARLGGLNFGVRFVVADPTHHELIDAFVGLDFTLVANDQSAAGLSHSVSLAVQAVQNTKMQALLICLADMPNVSLEHIAAMVAALGSETRVISSSLEGTPMPPALFPRAQWPRLEILSGGEGAKPLLADAILIEADAWSMADIDTPEDFAAIADGWPQAPL
jgi:molybdenum cofactor cytidylyltransferase